jgi:anti-sigma factor RsiW
MTICHLQAAGTIELYFYGELDAPARTDVERHLATCAECRQALDDMRTIQEALATRPDVSTPPGGDWSGFMSRLDDAIRRESAEPELVAVGSAARRYSGRYIIYAAMAAMIALVSISVGYILHARRQLQESALAGNVNPLPAPSEPAMAPPTATTASAAPVWSADAALVSLSEQHFERSKLVVYGLANKDAHRSSAQDWAYERQLASTLLSDTRLYRQAAEERGLKSVARVMGDLELVLLQTSMSSNPEQATLQQIQRLIYKRDLVTKMDVVVSGF